MDSPPHAASSPRLTVMAAAVLTAWLGFVIHNMTELGARALGRPDTLVPTAVYLLLAVVWLSPARRAGTWLLLGWGWLNLVGGGLLSVLPLPFLPYEPEQSVSHYAVHVVYGLAQVPMVVALTRQVRRRSPVVAVTTR